MIRHLLKLCAILTVAAITVSAHAAFPEKPIRIIISAAGGSSDVIARLVGKAMSDDLGTSVVIESHSGASGEIATQYVANSAPDGYTLLLAPPAFATTYAFHKNAHYRPMQDFTAVGVIGETPVVLIVPSGSPYKTLGEFVTATRSANPMLNYGTGGVGSSNHFNTESLLQLINAKAQQIPYRSDLEVVTALQQGEVQFAVLNAPGTVAALQSGVIRALGTATAAGSPSLPGVPTLSENGVPLVTASWFMLLAPNKTPPAALARLNKALTAALRQPRLQQQLRQMACDPHAAASPEAATTLLQNAVQQAESLIKAGIIKQRP